MIAQFEERIGHELHRAFGVRLHPLAASIEGRLDALRPEGVDQFAIVAGDLIGLLTEVEGQGDEFLAVGWVTERRERGAIRENGR
jgi:hypothetical protein